VLLVLFGCGRSLAADGAALGLIGYSPDSRYFAFEQFGVQDGSGFPYWDVFIVDLKTNEWVKGSPYRALVEDENATVAAARDRARGAAAGALAEHGISEPAMLLAATPSTEVSADRQRIAFDRWYQSMGARSGNASDVLGRHELVVEDIALPRPAECPAEDGESYGFRLTLKDYHAGTSRVIHEDKSIPASRHCPVGYDITAVVAQAGLPVTDRLVAIVGVYARGFEGANHRLIAVPFAVSE
jgi:predicted secreted protein